MAQRRRVVKKTIFIDSSVLFTAVNSVSGGSAKLFTLKNISLISSPVVLIETERNVRKKLHEYHLDRFFTLVDILYILKQTPDKKLLTQAQRVIVEKDAIILAEAKQAKTNYLLTLDKKHFLTPEVKAFLKPQKVMTPKMFFQKLK